MTFDDPSLLLAAGGAGALILAVLVFVVLRRRRRSRAGGDAVGPTAGGFRISEVGRGFADRLRTALASGGGADARLAAVEEVLLKADVGVRSTQTLLDRVAPRLSRDADADEALRIIAEEMRAILGPSVPAAVIETPHVVLVSGVNGVGKTTSVAKLAHHHQKNGKRVLLVAADTFRAAATAQLATWAERVGVDCVRRDEEGADPSSVVFEGLQAARARDADVVIVDTAGRLHVKANLVAELKKIARTIARLVEGAPHESLLVVDATTGQNASSQARAFSEALPLTGIVLTKLDGTARGGSVFAVTSELGLPVRYVGFGEKVDDFAEFDPEAFVDGLLGLADRRPG